MFKIADGREYFYQWDLDRQIIVEDPTITEVHFCNRTDDCSLVVEVEDLEIFADFKPISVLRTANVPNVILQKSFDVRVFGYDGKATRYDEVFKVKARTKPTDYVYTEVEIKRYEDLNKRIDEIEKNGISEEVITNAVEDYLERNPVDLTGYATEAYVENAIDNIEFPEPDLSKHALKSEIPTKVSQLQNDSKFITREEVPQQDLSEYAKKSEIPDVSDFITSIPSEYITETELSDKGYATESYVAEAIAGIEIPEGNKVLYNLAKPDGEPNKDPMFGDWIQITDEQTIEYLNRLLAGERILGYTWKIQLKHYLISDFNVATSTITMMLHRVSINGDIDYLTLTFKLQDGIWYWAAYTEESFTIPSTTSQLTNDSDFTTKAYVDSLFEGIATAEGGSY